MFGLNKLPLISGKLRTSITCPADYRYKGPWLLRVKRPEQLSPGIYAVEAMLVSVYRNTGKFKYVDGKQVSVDLNSDRILGTLKRSTGIKGPFPIAGLDSSLLLAWNAYADFRVWREDRQTFEGVSLEALAVYDARQGSKEVTRYYPKYPRFAVGDIVLTSYIPDDAAPGVLYGYARIERVVDEFEPIGVDKLSLISYTLRRSWKEITIERWNQFSRLKDYKQGAVVTMQKLPTSVQSRIRHQFFDPFYR